MRRLARHWLTIGLSLCLCEMDRTVATEPTDVEFFERNVRPVLAEQCYGCHAKSSDPIRAGLQLDSVEGLMRGGDSGPAVVPGDDQASLLLKAIRYDEDVSPMPPDGQLPRDVVQHFEDWIRRGAATPHPAVADAQSDPSANSLAAQHDHWSFRPPERAKSPSLTWRAEEGSAHIDRIVARHLVVRKLSLAPEAQPEVLVRRLYYDLIGLPPGYAEVQRFVSDRRPDAYDRLVDRLLASPQFGERWARYWLDVARYSDTKGYLFREDRAYPDAYKYRNWVIDSFNGDRPYDKFIQLQLAADQLADDDAEQLAAMGFLTLGRRYLNNSHDVIDDRIDVTTRGLLGLTVTCARCHDHKYDPIPTADYYSLYGVFASSREPRDAPSPLRLVDAETPTMPVVFLRGQPGRRGAEVPRQFLGLLAGPDRRPFRQGSGRLEMALEIASADNPLTARVFVNRVWGHLLGRYLVDTPSDFGTRCPRPPLAELLDDLSIDFIQHDWSIKWLVRRIVLSATYRQTSDASREAMAGDPENVWYSRANRRRLDFEAMRDAMLFVSQRLQGERIGGPSSEISGNAQMVRRSLYAYIDRQNRPGLFRVFDVASPDTHTPKRFETTVPQQALYLLNSPFAIACAQHVAELTEGTSADRVCDLYRRVLSRDPRPWELQRSLEFVTQSGSRQGGMDVWSRLSQVLLVSNEFLHLD